MRRFLLLIACGACALSAFAGERSDDEMMRIALSKLNSSNLVKGIGNGKATRVVEPALSTKTYTIFTPAEGSGFVIVSRHDEFPEVLGYSSGAFYAEDMPCCMKWWLDDVDRQMSSARTTMRRAPRAAASYEPVAPFITTKWSQGDPYDRKTPVIKGENAAAGCVAVALAQAMNYCQWPKSAKFDSYYYLGKSNDPIEVSVSSTYSWPYMEGYGYYYREGYTDHSDVTYVDPGRKGNLVAQLCADCGYAVHMQYTENGSGALMFEAGLALVDYFSYPLASVKYAERDCTSEEDWMNIIYTELQRRCPVLYGGQDASFGGHAFILGGMDANGLVYVDWGWQGEFDGYYDLSVMTPDRYNFESQHDMVYGIRTTPLPTDKPEPRMYSYDGSPYTFSITEEKDDSGHKHISLNIGFQKGMMNFSTATMDGEFGIFGRDITDDCNWQISATDPETIEPLVGYVLKQPADLFYYYVEDELIPGHTYRISFGTRDKYEGQWHSIICNGGEIGYEIKYTGNPATCVISEKMGVLYDAVAAPRATGNALPADNVTRVYDTAGRLVYSAPTRQFNLWDVPARGILVVKQGEQTRKVVR